MNAPQRRQLVAWLTMSLVATGLIFAGLATVVVAGLY